METGIFQIEFLDGRVYKIIYSNRTQKKRIIIAYSKIKAQCKSIENTANGLHTVTQLETMINSNTI